jgi:hypothetical protein
MVFSGQSRRCFPAQGLLGRATTRGFLAQISNSTLTAAAQPADDACRPTGTCLPSVLSSRGLDDPLWQKMFWMTFGGAAEWRELGGDSGAYTVHAFTLAPSFLQTRTWVRTFRLN